MNVSLALALAFTLSVPLSNGQDRSDEPKPVTTKDADTKEPSAPASRNSATEKQSPSQGASAAPAIKDRDQRLADLEKQLRDITKSVEALRKEAQARSPVFTNATDSSTNRPALDPNWLNSITWRCIGPAGMGGRIVDLAVAEKDPCTWWVATASGGLLKTTNNGITFGHQFDREAVVSLGAVCAAPSDPNIVWVGTGENNPRNSVSYGDGVYKSIDGGRTWRNMGLKQSFQIGRILIHPNDPNIVYVGALGRLYGANEERGLYKTTDGGTNWERVLYVDDKTGVIDMRMQPGHPDTLLVAMWERWRDEFDSHPGDAPPDGYNGYDPMKKWGPGSGIFKTTDAGRSWRRLTNGLPACAMGRIGLDFYRKDPDTVFAIIDTEQIGKGSPPKSGASVYGGVSAVDDEGRVKLTNLPDDGPAAKAGLQADDVVQSVDDQAVNSREELYEIIRSQKIGDKVTFKVLRDDKPVEAVVTLERRPDDPNSPGGGVYLGVTGEDAEGGARIQTVTDDSPASRAELKPDDLIQAAGDKPIKTYRELVEEIRRHKVGDKLKLKVQRGDETKEFEVTFTERPGRGRGGAQATTYLGVSGEDIEGGVRLTTILDNSPAAKAGLMRDDVVQAVGDKKATTYAQLLEQIRARKGGDKVKIKLKREGETDFIEVTLAARTAPPGAIGGPSTNRPSAAYIGGQIENAHEDQGTNGHQFGGLYKSTDAGETWTRINSLNPRPMYFSKVRVDPSDERFVYVLGVALHRSTNGGRTFRADGGRGTHADNHALWIDPRDGRHVILGTDGGFYATYDRMANWDHLNHAAIAQFYHVAISPKYPYHLVGGLQDNGTWMGPSLGLSGGPINEDWISIGGGDGFVCRVDPNDPDLVYAESQDGSIFRRHLRTGERGSIRPTRPDGAPPYRFNWNTPFLLSAHNSRVFYSAGNYVFRSFDRGNNLQPISPEITAGKRGSATALAESPRNPDVLYAGTDDGKLWVTRDGGKTWTDLTKNIGLPRPRWVATIEPSRFSEGRAYLALDAHRSNDDEPYLFVTEDFGRTWKSIRANLPWGSTRCLREDIRNQNLLYAGTEFGAWCSLDRGKFWARLGTNLPTVAVHEFALHPAHGELVAATHGRSLWISDVSALQQIAPENLKDKPALYRPTTVVRWRSEPTRSRTNRRFVGDNPPIGAQICYSLPRPAEKVTLKILDIAGATIREFPAKKDRGLYRVSWDLRSASASPRGGGGSGGGGGGQRAGRGQRAAAVALGPSVRNATYRVILTVDGTDYAQTLRVEGDPTLPPATIAAIEEAQEQEVEEMEEEDEEEELGLKPPIIF